MFDRSRPLATLLATLALALTAGTVAPAASGAQAAGNGGNSKVFVLDLHASGFLPLAEGAETTWGGGFGFAAAFGHIAMVGSTNIFSQNDETTANNLFAVGFAFGKYASGDEDNRAGSAITAGIWMPQGAGEVFPAVGVTSWTGGRISLVTGVDYILPKDGAKGAMLLRVGLGYRSK